MRARALGLIGLLGGLGGAINASLCYFQQASDFSWDIIPAGAVHGALLAVVTIAVFNALSKRGTLVRWLGVPLSGWLAGWLSFISFGLYIASKKDMWWLNAQAGSSGLTPKEILENLFWPFTERAGVERLWMPYAYFGLVSALWYASLIACLSRTFRRPWPQMLLGALSGALGSLWWWSDFKPWYFSLIHGTIWGALVGYGIWRAQQTSKHPA